MLIQSYLLFNINYGIFATNVPIKHRYAVMLCIISTDSELIKDPFEMLRLHLRASENGWPLGTLSDPGPPAAMPRPFQPHHNILTIFFLRFVMLRNAVHVFYASNTHTKWEPENVSSPFYGVTSYTPVFVIGQAVLFC